MNYKNFYDETNYYRHWLRLAGLLLIPLGMVLVILNTLGLNRSVQSVLLLAISLIYIYHAITFWRGKYIGMILHLFAAAGYITIGLFQVKFNSLYLIDVLTIFLISFIPIAIFRIYISAVNIRANFMWVFTFITGLFDIIPVYVLFRINFLTSFLQVPLYLNLIYIDIIFGCEQF